MATDERYRWIIVPVVNPYELPPAVWQAPDYMLMPPGEDGVRRVWQDKWGFMRNKLRAAGKQDAHHPYQCMKRCYAFVTGQPNQAVNFADDALDFLRAVDSVCWQLADSAWFCVPLLDSCRNRLPRKQNTG